MIKEEITLARCRARSELEREALIVGRRRSTDLDPI